MELELLEVLDVQRPDATTDEDLGDLAQRGRERDLAPEARCTRVLLGPCASRRKSTSLVAAGHVTRRPDERDRRSIRIALEPETFRAFAAVYLPLGHQVYATTGGLSDSERATVVRALLRMTGAFDAARGALGGAPG